MKDLIVGVDAGATSAYAVLDLSGNLVKVESGKGWGESEVAKRISPFSPEIIACDTNPPNKFSKKLSALFSAKLFVPKHSLSHLEKILATKECACKNAHERDALAAALKAYHLVQNKLKQARRHFKQAGFSESEIEVRKSKVLSGTSMHALK